VFRSLRNGHYHSLIDNLPRLALLHDPRLAGEELLVLYRAPLSTIEQHVVPRLLPPNATLVPVDRRDLLRVDRLVFPELHTRRFSAYHHHRFRELLADRLLPDRPSRRSNRIFISRVDPGARGNRIITNEDELMVVLGRFGFERHVLEGMSPADEMALFYDAELVVGAHGAGLANTIFAREIGVLELFPTRVHPCYHFLCLAYGHRHDYLCGDAPTRNSSFAVDVRAVEEKLVRSFGLATVG
jgi:capsular polysaccharide biosynthesis protein